MLERKDELKEKVLNFTLDTFILNGYKAINMDIIAKTLGVSKRTLYEIFPSKDDMLTEAIKIHIVEFEKELNDIAMKMIANNMQTFFENLYEIFKLAAKHASTFGENFTKEVKLYLPKFYESCLNHNHKRFVNFKNVIELGKEKGYFREDIDSELFLKVLHFSMGNILRAENMVDIPMKIEDAIKQIFKIIFTGAMTPEFTNEFNTNLKIEYTN